MRITMYLGHQEREGAMREIRMDLWLSVVIGGQEGIRKEGDQVVPLVIRRERGQE